MIGVRGEDQRAFRGAARQMCVELAERVGGRRDTGTFELRANRVQRRMLVIRSGRRSADPTDDLEDLALTE